MDFNVWVIPFSFSVLQALFLCLIFLVDTRGRRSANLMLAGLMLLIAYLHGGWLLRIGRWADLAPGFMAVANAGWLLVGPLIYGYITATTTKTKWLWADLLHIVPFLLHLAMQLHALWGPESFGEARYVTFLYQAVYGRTTVLELLLHLVLMGQLLGYVVASLRRLLACQRLNETLFAGEKAFDRLIWTRRLLIIFTVYVCYETLLGTAMLLGGSLTMAYVYFSVLMLTAFPVMLAYHAIRHADAVFPVLDVSEEEKYQHSALSPAYLQEQAERLHILMTNEAPYRRGDLKLMDLAQMLEIPMHHLTQVLNQHVGQTFNVYVNAYRIQEAKIRLIDPEQAHLSILGIALDVGFNSKATFNRLFKKHTRLTPSQYIEQHTSNLMDKV